MDTVTTPDHPGSVEADEPATALGTSLAARPSDPTARGTRVATPSANPTQHQCLAPRPPFTPGRAEIRRTRDAGIKAFDPGDVRFSLGFVMLDAPLTALTDTEIREEENVASQTPNMTAPPGA
jgi:hypothetical protein